MLSFPFSGLRLIRDVLRSTTRGSGNGCRRRADVACLTGRYRWRDSWWCGRYCWRPGRWACWRRWSRSRRCCVGHHGWPGRWCRQDRSGRSARRSWRCCRGRDAGRWRSAGRRTRRRGRTGKIGSSRLFVYDKLAGFGFGNHRTECDAGTWEHCLEELGKEQQKQRCCTYSLTLQRMQEVKIGTLPTTVIGRRRVQNLSPWLQWV